MRSIIRRTPSPFSVALFLMLCSCAHMNQASSSPDAASPVAKAPDISPTPPDPYLYLEEVDSPKALTWVKERNAISEAAFATGDEYASLQKKIQASLDSKELIPTITKIGAYYYNLHQDEKNPRGLLRRVASLESYQKAEPKWESVLDLDALSKAENIPWSLGSIKCLPPLEQRCLIGLARGGSDAVVVREFDLGTKAWVPNDFTLKEAKTYFAWRDLDTIYVATDFGPGSLTTSGYPRIVKEWRRGTPLASAKTIFTGEPQDMFISASRKFGRNSNHDLVEVRRTFYTTDYYLIRNGELVKIQVPNSAEVTVWNDYLLIQLRDPWDLDGQHYSEGSLLAAKLDAFLAGNRDLARLFVPTATQSLFNLTQLKDYLLITELDSLQSKARLLEPSATKGWSSTPYSDVAAFEKFMTSAVDSRTSNEFFVMREGYLTPPVLSLAQPGSSPKKLKSTSSQFPTEGLSVRQHSTTSKDGTKVYYFEVGPTAQKPDGKNPTLLYGYGGFEISLLPTYNPINGIGWLSRGGTLVVANIRGGGEFGPRWHQAALREHRQRAYDDFAAVAEDLIRRGVTSPKHLAIQGGSNGGLLMGVMLTQHPELFGAVVAQVPLLDMRRFSKLHAGASWMAEYGDPDKPSDWAFISKYSPYQNVKPGTAYPPILFTTSTRDDRVHPSHARKMAALLNASGHPQAYFWENIEGGHKGSSTNKQRASQFAMVYNFVGKTIGLGAPAK